MPLFVGSVRTCETLFDLLTRAGRGWGRQGRSGGAEKHHSFTIFGGRHSPILVEFLRGKFLSLSYFPVDFMIFGTEVLWMMENQNLNGS